MLIAWAALALLALALLLAALAVRGRARWARATAALQAGIAARHLPAVGARYDARELEGLPTPVRRYFLTVLRDGQPLITDVRLRQAGQLNLGVFGPRPRWVPFRATQQVRLRRPAFVWDAWLLWLLWLPWLTLRLRDAYTDGHGHLKAALPGLWTLVDAEAADDLARGELMRWLMEAVWYPTALLPSQGTDWRAAGPASADAEVADGNLRVRLRFTFGVDGLVASVRADARAARLGGRLRLMPWEGRFSNWQERGGMQVPLDGEAAWHPVDGRLPYWRGSVTHIDHDWAPPA